GVRVTIQPGAPALTVLSADRRVLAAWHAGLAEIARYGRRAREVLAAAQAGDYPAVFEDCSGHEGALAGLAVPPGAMRPPGWRMNGGLAVPDPAIAAGRWVAAALREAGHPGEPRRWLPGLPSRLAAAPQVPGWRAAIGPDGRALYAGWDKPADGAG